MKNKLFALLFVLFTPLFLWAQKDSTSMDTLLQLSLEQLMDIKVVTASGFPQTAAEAPSTITVITAKQIAERGYEQLEDALRDIPGIDMIHLNGYAPTLIYFRGMYGAENLRALLMIDGIVENNIIGTNDFAGPAYSLHNVERIEIIWGPASALYGANAFGGVINIITKKGGDINGFTAQQGFGTFNTSFEKVSMGMRKSNFEFDVAGTLYSTDGPKFKNRDPNYAASYVDKAYSLNARVSYYAKNSTTTFGYRTYNTPIGWGTFFNSPTVYLGLPPQGNKNAGIIGLVTRDVRGEKSGLESPFLRTYFIQNEYKPDEKFNLLSRITYRETGTSDDSYGYVTISGRNLVRVKEASYSNSLDALLSANYSLSDKHRFSAGIELQRENVERGSRRQTIDTTDNIYLIDGRDTVTNLNATFLPRQYDIRKNFGSYFQYMLSTGLLGKTNFTTGIRYDYNSYFGNSVNPRIVAVNQPNKKWTFKLQFGTAFRAPTNTEIYRSIGMPLQTEKIKTYEANVIYSFSKKLNAQVNIFRNELSDVILIGNLSGLNTDNNPGSQRANGLEAIFNFVPAKNITGFVNFTYQDPKWKNLVTGKTGLLPGVARFKGNAGLTMQVQDMFVVTLSENWVGTRQVPSTDPYGPVAGYFLTNCVISTKELFNKGITASLNIDNVFNTKWLDPGIRTADGFLFSTVLEQPGVNGLFKIGIRL
jgi:outer membrane receptor for ferrienterochelin and colicins